MRAGRPLSPSLVIQVQNSIYTFQAISQLQCLGSVISATGHTNPAMEHRIQLANAAFHARYDMWTNRYFSFDKKCKLYARDVVPIATYNSAVWVLGEGVLTFL